MTQSGAFFYEYEGDANLRRYSSAMAVAGLSVVALIGLSIQLGLSSPMIKAAEDALDVTFVDKVAPPPPPPPVMKALPRALEPMPANLPAHMQKVVVKELPKVKMIQVPLTIRKTNLAEGDPSQSKIYVLEGSGDGDGAAALPIASARPTVLPPTARAPEPYSGNASPAYPNEAKATGLEDTVILRIVVSTTGLVTVKDVLRGDEPFVAAAIAAVQTWKYSPAIKDGHPITVFHIVRIPFKMRA